jgi:probable F420-dependent oxidoreductase
MSVSPRPIRIGLHLKPQHADYADLRRAVLAAEAAGVDLVTTWDHFFPLTGDPDGKHFESWTLLSAWAAITDRVELGTLVSSIGYRNPDLLADMSRTVDHISGGRLILGLGAGWAERDYDEYGYSFGTPGARLAALEAALPRIKARWAGLNPPPVRSIPVMIGGTGEKKTLRYVARHADIWHGLGDLETLARKHAVLDGWCQTEGRDPADIERGTSADDGPGTDGAHGDALVALGTTLVTVRTDGPRYDMGPLRDWLAWRDDRNVRTTEAPALG